MARIKFSIILILLAAAVAGVQELRIQRLKADVAEKGREIAELKQALGKQNAATETLSNDAKLATAEAESRVMEIFIEAEKKKAKLPLGHGPKVMNQWFSEALK
jgi:hypothetical protein